MGMVSIQNEEGIIENLIKMEERDRAKGCKDQVEDYEVEGKVGS